MSYVTKLQKARPKRRRRPVRVTHRTWRNRREHVSCYDFGCNMIFYGSAEIFIGGKKIGTIQDFSLDYSRP